MRIIIKDFIFKGKHYEDIPEDKIVPYVIESLNELLKED